MGNYEFHFEGTSITKRHVLAQINRGSKLMLQLDRSYIHTSEYVLLLLLVPLNALDFGTHVDNPAKRQYGS